MVKPIDHIKAFHALKPADVVSIIVPVYNEGQNVEKLYREVCLHVPKEHAWELIFVDDGSTDDSAAVIRHLAREDSRVKAVFLSRNYGQQVALSAGYDMAGGRAVITMDADLQHPPRMIPAMLDAWQAGHDIVIGIRDDKSQVGVFKKLCSNAFYGILKRLSHLELITGAADFRLLDYKVVFFLRQYREQARFLRGIISDMGFKRKILSYTEMPRQVGRSKYTMFKMMRLALAGVVSFSNAPLRLSIWAGICVSAASIAYAAWIVYEKIVYGAPVGLPSILVGVFFIGGVQLISIGILGEYLGQVFKEVKERPLYCISEIIE